MNINLFDTIIYTNEHTGHQIESQVIGVSMLYSGPIVVCANGRWHYVDDVVKKEIKHERV